MKYSERDKLIQQAKECLDKKEYEKALEYYDKAIELDNNNNADIYNRKGIVYYDLKEYEKALECYDKAIQLDPEYIYSYRNKGLVYNKLKKYDEALEWYDKAIEIDSTYVNAYNNKGLTYEKIREYEKALECYDKAIELDPANANIYNNKAIIHRKLKDYDQALECYDQAIKLDNTYAYVYNNKGLVYEVLEEYDKALKSYDKAISLDKNFMEAFNNRGVVYEKIKKYPNALSDYNMAIKLDNKYPRVYRNKGDVYFELEEYEKAIENYKRAFALDENNKWLTSKIELAKTELEEQKKNEENKDRDRISKIIDEIKDILEYKKDQVCHYTSTFVFKELCKGSNLRFSHVAIVNDPTEGKTLYDFLGVESIERKDQSGFIGSFVESHKNDSLPLWRAYGRDGKGVSICLDTSVLTELKTPKEATSESKGATVNKTEEARRLYKIAYVQRTINEKNEESWGFLIDGEKSDALEIALKELKVLLEPLIKDKNVKNEEALEPVVEIQYLFKNEIYQGEREVRYYKLLPNDFSQIQWDDEVDIPTTYIEVENDIRNQILNVTLGPKVKNASTWMALYKTMLARQKNKTVSITQSKIPYR